MGTYTPGPWRLRRSDLAVVNADASALIAWTDRNTYGKTRDDIQANARRIVACVNACEGINPEAVPDLLTVLRAAVARVELANREGDPILSAWLPDAQAAIAKAEGR